MTEPRRKLKKKEEDITEFQAFVIILWLVLGVYQFCQLVAGTYDAVISYVAEDIRAKNNCERIVIPDSDGRWHCVD